MVNHHYATNAQYYYHLHNPVYQNNDGQYYSFCSFDWNQTCGYRSQPNSLPFYLRDEIETLSSLGMMVFDVSKVDRNQAIGARISGRYYSAYNFTKGCLMIKSLTYGPAISHWMLRQRDHTDRILYHYMNDWQTKMSHTNIDSYWTFLSLPIDLSNGAVKFFIDDSTILTNIKMVKVSETPYGLPSDSELVFGQIDDVDVYILGRHGHDHDISPSNVNYRANLWTLKQLGCTHILATSACGSLKESIAPGHLGIMDQYIDRTNVRGGRSFYKVAHIPQPRPFDPTLQDILYKSAIEAGYICHPSLTAVCIEGPRFSTLAESRLYQSWGADLVNMTMVPEVQLANELGLIYATLALVTDYDCWHSDELSVSVDLVTKTLRELSTKAKDVLVRSIKHIKQIDWTKNLENKAMIARNSIMVE
ncbi:S-methyl-5'-thioadenosine phosphorylase-like protein [Euroglyphus maynei]|uniref:S-methyl-5'-thioadenosine phosphorylase n=1 Tax=Euroglyphus maynei TaxID=6958 RepID=A0A1Y3BBL0_EURMA|nr:S-methyl-5'-thioadenosine phosphorylase-like protein [Euroglyphus maynei]